MNSVAASDTSMALVALSQALGAQPSNLIGDLDKTSSEKFASAIIKHRLSRAIVNSPHALGLEEKDLERVTTDALAHTHAAFQLIGHTAQVAGILESENIDFLVIKGVALGALSQTPAGRGAGDVDILVDPGDVPRVHQLFQQAGFRPAHAQPDVNHPRTWKIWGYLDRESTYIGHSTHIDLHWRISSQRRLFPHFDELFSRRELVNVAGTHLPTLSLPDSVAAACYHAYFDQFQPLRSILDVVSLLQTSEEITFPPYSRRLRRLIAGVLDLTLSILPGVVDKQILHHLRHLPAPHPMVKKRFEGALHTPKVVWEESQDTGAVWAKMRAEAPFDSAADIVPRFIGKRLFYFPHWSAAQQTTSLTEAFKNRIRVELQRKKR